MISDAYAAGLVDGEGCISIGKNGGLSYSALVQIGMTEKALPVLRQMHAQYGGALKESRKATDRWAVAWIWTVIGHDARPFLLKIKPHLLLKREQAALALALEELRLSCGARRGNRAQWTAAALEQAELLKQRMHELNRNGPPPERFPAPMGAIPIARRAGGVWIKEEGGQADLFGDALPQRFAGPWPSAGLLRSGTVYSIPNLPESLNAAVACSLSQILEADVPAKYFLSPKACAGILRRAEKRGKTLPDALAAALRAVAGETTPTA